MAYQIPESKYELIQSTINNPEYKAKLTRILSEMSASELAFVMENSPPQEKNNMGFNTTRCRRGGLG